MEWILKLNQDSELEPEGWNQAGKYTHSEVMMSALELGKPVIESQLRCAGSVTPAIPHCLLALFFSSE